MLLKVLLLAGLAVQVLEADKAKESVSFSVVEVWQSYNRKKHECTCDVKEEWKQGVQQYYDGCREATRKFRGPSYVLADTVSNSTVLASSSASLLESISKGRNLGISGFNIIKEFDKVLLILVEEFNDVVAKLSGVIGKLTCSINDVINDLGCAFSNFMKEFMKSGLTEFRKKVDYAPVLKILQKFMNTVGLIAETLLNFCVLATSEVIESVTVLTLVVNYFVLAVQGVNSCYQTVLYEQKRKIPQNIKLCSASFDYVLLEVTQAVDLIVFPFTDSITALLNTFVNITLFLNTSLKNIFGIFEGVAITVGQITKNLTDGVSSTVTGVTKGVTNILKGVIPTNTSK